MYLFTDQSMNHNTNIHRYSKRKNMRGIVVSAKYQICIPKEIREHLNLLWNYFGKHLNA